MPDFDSLKLQLLTFLLNCQINSCARTANGMQRIAHEIQKRCAIGSARHISIIIPAAVDAEERSEMNKKNSEWERKKEKQNSVLELFIRKMVGMPKSRFIPKVWLFFFLHSFFTAAEAVYFAPTSPNISINFYMRLTRHISSARTAHTPPILSSYQWLDNNNNNRIESMNVCWAEWLSSNSVVV